MSTPKSTLTLHKKDGEKFEGLVNMEKQRFWGPSEEYTNGKLEDRIYFTPSFLPKGKPEGSRSGVAKGLQ